MYEVYVVQAVQKLGEVQEVGLQYILRSPPPHRYVQSVEGCKIASFSSRTDFFLLYGKKKSIPIQ